MSDLTSPPSVVCAHRFPWNEPSRRGMLGVGSAIFVQQRGARAPAWENELGTLKVKPSRPWGFFLRYHQVAPQTPRPSNQIFLLTPAFRSGREKPVLTYDISPRMMWFLPPASTQGVGPGSNQGQVNTGHWPKCDFIFISPAVRNLRKTVSSSAFIPLLLFWDVRVVRQSLPIQRLVTASCRDLGTCVPVCFPCISREVNTC